MQLEGDTPAVHLAIVIYQIGIIPCLAPEHYRKTPQVDGKFQPVGIVVEQAVVAGRVFPGDFFQADIRYPAVRIPRGLSAKAETPAELVFREQADTVVFLPALDAVTLPVVVLLGFALERPVVEEVLEVQVGIQVAVREFEGLLPVE